MCSRKLDYSQPNQRTAHNFACLPTSNSQLPCHVSSHILLCVRWNFTGFEMLIKSVWEKKASRLSRAEANEVRKWRSEKCVGWKKECAKMKRENTAEKSLNPRAWKRMHAKHENNLDRRPPRKARENKKICKSHSKKISDKFVLNSEKKLTSSSLHVVLLLAEFCWCSTRTLNSPHSGDAEQCKNDCGGISICK